MKPHLEGDMNGRKIFYKIKHFGDDVVKNKRGKYFNLNPSLTNQNIIFITVALHEVGHFEHLIFYTEKGVMIPKLSLDTAREGYVLLGTIQVYKKCQQGPVLMSENRIELAKRFLTNQVKQKSGNYHFQTSGIIFGIWDTDQNIIATSTDIQ